MERKLLCMIVQQSGEMICNHLRRGQRLAYRSHWVRGNSKEIRGQRSGVRNALVEVRGLPGAQKRGCQVPGHGLQFVSRHSLQFSDAGMKIYLAGEAEAGSAGEQPAKE